MNLSFYKDEPAYDDTYKIKEYLATKYSLNEVNTYLWNKTSFVRELNINKDNVKLLGKSEDNILRDDLNLSMLEVAKTNIKNYDNVNIFEIGTIIKDNDNKKMLSILLGAKEEDIKTIYNKSKDKVVNLFRDLKNLNVNFEFSSSDYYYNQDLTQNIIVNNLVVGQIKPFTKIISNKISKKSSFIAIEIG